MAGFHSTSTETTMFADNVDFTGNALPSPQVTADGQLLIGSSATPNIRVGTLTAGSGISITNGHGSITVAAAASVPTTFTEDIGSATPAANNLNILGTSAQGISTSGSGSTVTLTNADWTTTQKGVGTLATNAETIAGTVTTKAVTPDDLKAKLGSQTAHNVALFQGTTAAMTPVAPSATSGVPLISQGASSDPAFGTATVPGGGTGIVSATAYAPVCGGTTTTGNFQSASTGLSSSGFVLTSNGASSLPSWQAASGISTVNGDSGSVTGSTISLKGSTGSANCGSSVKFSAASATELDLVVTDASSNTIIGNGSGNSSIIGTGNSAFGSLNLTALTSGGLNNAFGRGALVSLQGGSSNNSFGNGSLNVSVNDSNNSAFGNNSLSALNGGSNNSAFGSSSLVLLTTGSNNCCVGKGAGSLYTTSESSNISLNNSGVAAESHTLRIGQGTGTSDFFLNQAFISGINGNTVSNAKMVTINSSTDQLGVATIPTGAITWTDEGTNFSPAATNGYFVTATATATLPASPSQGDTISFIVDTTNVLTIKANTGQVIRIGSAVSASAGTAASTARGDSITLVYRSSATAWISLSAPQGTWTLT